MKTYKLLIVAASLLIASSVSNAAEVRSISREVVSNVDGVRALTVKVRCAEVAAARVIQHTRKSRLWCSSELPTACSKNKVKAAEKVCGTHFERLLREYKQVSDSEFNQPAVASQDTAANVQAESSKVTVTEQDLLKIERERILLEQKKLDLKRQDLELKKRQLEALGKN